MPDVPENNLLLTAEGYVRQPAELDDGGCFEPFIPQVSISPAPEPAPKPKPPSLMPLIDEIPRKNGCVPTPTDTPAEAKFPAPTGAEGTGDTEIAKPSETLPASVEAPLPPPRFATAIELFTWIKQTLLVQAHLPEDTAELVAIWTLSTWFQDALNVLPCLVLTGSAHDARSLLHVLSDFCHEAKLLAGFGRSHLEALRCCRTNLISEPNLDRRTADLLSNLTDRGFLVVQGSYISCYSKSTAIYAGENLETHRILNSIHIHMVPTNAQPAVIPPWLHKLMKRVPVHLEQYRNKNLCSVRRWTWAPSGLSSETATLATVLGRCIVDAPELRRKLVVLLKSQDQQRHTEMSNTSEAIVVEAILAFIRDGREQAYAREIAAKANRLLEARGETARLSPERVGHVNKKLGLRTRRLSQTGNGLTFDKVTRVRIEELAAVYMMEDTPAETENLHGSQTTESK